MPRIERREFLRLLEWAALEVPHRAPLEAARTPFAVVSAYDYAARRQALLLAPVEMLRESVYVVVQSRPVEGSAFATVTSWRPWDAAAALPAAAAPAEPEG